VTRINLLPDGVVARQGRRRATRIAIAAAAVALTVGSTWVTVARHQLNDLAAKTAAAQARLNQERERAGRDDAESAKAAALRGLLAQGDRLSQPVSLPGAMTLLTNLLPDSVALTRLTIEAPTVDVTERKSGNKAAPTSLVTRLSLEGLAINDLELAQVVSELGAQKAFANVKLLRSRPVASAGVTRYAFEMSIDVPPAAAAAAEDGVAQAGRDEHGG
jgi:hypothetical protein